uniref:Uncharacterized protein n=1 Tax=Arundo donax TaxID=35708 RepID=A0A0A9A500_ARUDO
MLHVNRIYVPYASSLWPQLLSEAHSTKLEGM